MSVNAEAYRAIAGAFPTGVAIVTARDTDGTPRGLTTQTFVGLSLDPPLVLVSLARDSRTLGAVERSGAFAVNILRADAEGLALRFASKRDDKFDGVPHEPSTVARGAPLLVRAAVAYAECATERLAEAGDHLVLIGRVDGGAVLGGTPLLYHRRTYAAAAE